MLLFADLPSIAVLAIVGTVVLALHVAVVRLVQPAPFREVVALLGRRLRRRPGSLAEGVAA